MTLKTKILTANTGSELQSAVNLFLADKTPANVLDIYWGPSTVGANIEQACFIVYQE